MTASITVYNMPQVATLTLGGDTGAYLMNYPVNRTDFKLTKGVTTEVHFFVKDVDRKPVTLAQMANTGITAVRITITDDNTDTLLLGSQTVPAPSGDKSVLIPAPGIAPTKGVWMLKLESTDIADWPLGRLKYSVTLDRTNDQVMLYTDRGYGPYGALEVLEGPFPFPPEVTTITPSDMTYNGPSLYTGAYAGAANVGNPSGLQSAVMHMSGFKGTFTLQASLENSPSAADSDWFPATIANKTFIETTYGATIANSTISFNAPVDGPLHVQAQGNYMWMRFIVNEEMDTPNAFQSIDYRAE